VVTFQLFSLYLEHQVHEEVKNSPQLLPPFQDKSISASVLRPVSVEFHGGFHGIKYADVAKRENVRVSWDVRRVSTP
jgi:hypothetical protein